MASVFRKDDKFYDKPNRNNFDLSFQNNFTLNAGNIVPVFCKEVIPGDSFKIDPTFGIRAMPLVWPIQTRMKCYLHFYYVRNRNLWKDWPDFIGGTKQNLVPPYIYLTDQNRDMVNTGKIGDYFGIPSVTFGEFGSEIENTFSAKYYNPDTDSFEYDYVRVFYGAFSTRPQAGQNLWNITSKVALTQTVEDYNYLVTIVPAHRFIHSDLEQIRVKLVRSGDYLSKSSFVVAAKADGTISAPNNESDNFGVGNISDYATELRFNNPSNEIAYFAIFTFTGDGTGLRPQPTGRHANAPANLSDSMLLYTWYDVRSGEATENSEVGLSELPFISNANPTGLRMSSLPFRAYESIYNCMYRNAENNPLIGEDGQPEYNKWILNNEGGADTTHYKLHQRNWEDDFLTTALPSPQQGNAPLVGLTGTATINFASEDGTETVTATTDENGQITAINAGTSNLSDALAQMVDYGISINDFRNVNALQRWLENNIRRGYKYQDQIQSHYGVSVRYDELDMPEFIGGASQSFAVNQISQTVSSDTQVLGDYAGQASCVGSGREITHYCDEHGYIIGVLCISPVPNYSQLLPKHFLKSDKFDFYFPEYGHIGMQPIPLKEIAPLQTYRQQKADASVNLEDTFGYQRAWYEYLASTDEVHGLFRNQLRNFVMNRTFDTTPELGAEFTTIDPEQLNDVFAVQDTGHKFLGQVYFDVKAKRPIPLYGIPKLE